MNRGTADVLGRLAEDLLDCAQAIQFAQAHELKLLATLRTLAFHKLAARDLVLRNVRREEFADAFKFN